MRQAAVIGVILIAACQAEPPSIEAPTPLLSGSEFVTDETRVLQDDEFANPGMIWVERGAVLFENDTSKIACSYCHGEGEQKIDIVLSAAHHPKLNTRTQSVQTLQSQILTCQVDHQDQNAARFDDENTLALTVYVTHQAKGQPLKVDMSSPEMHRAFAEGKAYYFTRRGQMNFSCAQCHDDQWGKRMRGDTISQGHPVGFPAYRFEWENLGSLHQRLADCDRGVRAEAYAAGSAEYIALEVYLAARAQGLPLESPAVRR